MTQLTTLTAMLLFTIFAHGADSILQVNNDLKKHICSAEDLNSKNMRSCEQALSTLTVDITNPKSTAHYILKGCGAIEFTQWTWNNKALRMKCFDRAVNANVNLRIEMNKSSRICTSDVLLRGSSVRTADGSPPTQTWDSSFNCFENFLNTVSQTGQFLEKPDNNTGEIYGFSAATANIDRAIVYKTDSLVVTSGHIKAVLLRAVRAERLEITGLKINEIKHAPSLNPLHWNILDSRDLTVIFTFNTRDGVKQALVAVINLPISENEPGSIGLTEYNAGNYRKDRTFSGEIYETNDRHIISVPLHLSTLIQSMRSHIPPGNM